MSPELDLSYSRIKNWRFCRQAYHYAHIERIEPRKKPPQFAIGGAVHELLEYYHKGKPYQPALDRLKEEYALLTEDEKEHYGNVPENARKIVEGYIKHYTEADRSYQFRHTEESFGPHELIPGITFTAKPDAIVEDTMGRFLLWEMKTGKRLPDDNFRLWNLQTLLYAWAVRQSGIPIHAVVWDHIRTKLPTEPRLLVKGGLSRRDIDTTYDVYLDAILRNGLNPDDYFEELKALRNSKDFYRRYKLPIKETMLKHILDDVRVTAKEMDGGIITRDISQMKCPNCMYHSLCEAVLLGGDEEYVKQKEFVPKVRRMETTTLEGENDGEN